MCSVPIHLFQVVQPQRTSLNLFEPLQCRESKVCIGEFGVVRLYRTFSNHIFTRGSRCVGYLYTTSGRLNCSELLRTFSNHYSAEKAMYVQVSYMSLGYRTFSNHIFTRKSRRVVYLYTCSGWFNRSEPPRTFMNHFNTEKARCVEVYHMRSKWFDYTEPFRTTY